MKFTDKSVSALKAQKLRYEVWEEGRSGFGLRIAPNGRKTWVWMYRFGGKARRMSFGTYPLVGLAQAHVMLAEARRILSEGNDPGAAGQEEKQRNRDAETVNDLVELYLEKWAKPRKRSAAEDERILRRDVIPTWNKRKAHSITRRDVVHLLDAIVNRGAPIAANRTLAVTRKMFNFAVSRDLLPHNPCTMVAAPSRENSRDRVLSLSEVSNFWKNLNKTDISNSIRLIFQFMLVTGQRKAEVARAEWSEIDLESAIWTIPASKAKNNSAHRVPLSALAIHVLNCARRQVGHETWVFCSARSGLPPHDTAIDHAMKRHRDVLGANLTPHDLRRTAASHLSRLGTNRLVVAKILNHSESGVTATYDRHGYDAEKRSALDLLSTELMATIHI
jgi:integrase